MLLRLVSKLHRTFIAEVLRRAGDICEGCNSPAPFNRKSDGTPYLIEINGRFWGSLQLSIEAGIDFPFLLYKLALGNKLECELSYKEGVKSRWLLGDLDHFYLKLTK